MLLAPNDPLRSPPTSPPSPREEATFNYALIALCAALLSYSLVAGFGIAGGGVPVERAYLYMTPLPLALALWCAFGAVRRRPFELGTALFAGGWAMVFVVLLLKHLAVQSAVAAGVALAQVSDSPLVWICAFLAVALLGAGAFLGLRAAPSGA